MKSFKQIEKEYSPEEIAESFVFPGSKDPEKREALLSAIREYKSSIPSKQPEHLKIISLLLQLRYLMEDYIQLDAANKEASFSYFLKEYIDRLNKKSKEFATEISIDPSQLSQVINNKRRPSEILIFRLEIHSNRNFPAMMWFKLLEKDRMYELKHHREIIEKESKNVKEKLTFSL